MCRDCSKDCRWLYEQLERLPLNKYYFNRKELPKDGIYFFYEEWEEWGHGESKSRIVRIGAHQSGNFRKRINDHYVFNDNRLDFDANRAVPKGGSIFESILAERF